MISVCGLAQPRSQSAAICTNRRGEGL